MRLKDVRPGDTVDRAQGRRRDPRGRRAGAGRAPEEVRAVGVPDDVPVSAASPLVRLEGESDTFCTNPECPNQRDRASSTSRRAARWTSRASASGRCTLFLDARSRPRPGRHLLPPTEDLLALEGFGDISVATCSTRSRRRRRARSPNLLVGLGIRHLGGAGATLVARRRSAISTRSMAATEARLAVRRRHRSDHRRERARVVRTIDRNRALIDKLRGAGVNFAGPSARRVPQTLAGQVDRRHRHARGFSRERGRGGDQGPRRQVARERVEEDRPRSSSASGPGAAKLTKAEELGVPILDEAGFVQLLETGELPGG